MRTRLFLAAFFAISVVSAHADDNPFGGFLKKVGNSAVDSLKKKTGVSESGDNADSGGGSQTDRIVRGIKSTVKTAKAFRKSFSEISESEEYYIGRSVAAQILSRYKPNTNSKLNNYVQSVLQIVAMSSDRPFTFKGYHAQVLESPEVNAFAAPGGFIFLTTGLLKLLENEDQLGCVLAHEVDHVAAKHGLAAIKASRLTEAFAILGEEAAKNSGSAKAAKLTEAFGGSVDDIVNKLVVNGYGREQEFAADKAGVVFARRANYHPKALVKVLSRMSDSGVRWGFYKNHPGQKQRLEQLNSMSLSPSKSFVTSDVRRERFAAAVAGL